MMFGVVLRVIGSKGGANFFLVAFGQKPWTNPFGFWSKFQSFLNFLYR